MVRFSRFVCTPGIGNCVGKPYGRCMGTGGAGVLFKLTEFGDICLEEVWYEVELPFSNS